VLVDAQELGTAAEIASDGGGTDAFPVAQAAAVDAVQVLLIDGSLEGRDKFGLHGLYCRGDWGEPKSDASNTTIPVNGKVIERIQRLRVLTVEVKSGRAVRRYRVVKADGPDDLVFQSVRDGQPMRDNNILVRHIKPAARKVGFPWVNWLVLRRSYSTWLRMVGTDPRDRQSLMRHSRFTTTAEVYEQDLPESQLRAVEKLGSLVN